MYKTIQKNLALQLRLYRTRHQLSQSELAKKLQMSEYSIREIEKERFNPRLSLFCKLIDFLNIDFKDLLE